MGRDKKHLSFDSIDGKHQNRGRSRERKRTGGCVGWEGQWVVRALGQGLLLGKNNSDRVVMLHTLCCT